VCEGLGSAGAVVLSWLGFCALALGQERHWRAVAQTDECNRHPAPRLIVSGVLAQVLAGVLLVHAHGMSFGAMLAVLIVTGTAMTVTFALSWKPALLRLVATLCRRY
jgi:hypothetical protein